MKLKKVLLVDDDQITNNLNTRIIKKLGICEQVDVATNGKEGLDYLRNCEVDNYPDLILLDINMPIMNGFEFIEAYHREFAQSKTVILMMLTTSLQNSDYKKAKSYPEVSEYIAKPLSPAKLKDILSSAFGES
ncbi:MAG: response regulator [Bacteroidia bacterium]